MQYPCTNCVYKPVCGSPRTEPCAGRQTKTEKRKSFNKMVSDLYEECLDMDWKDYEEFEDLDKSYLEDLIQKHGYNRAREILVELEYINS